MISQMRRAEILTAVIAKLGARRALEAKRTSADVLTNGATVINPTGFDGVDELPNRRFRSRIRFTDALSGADTRLTLGAKFGCAEEAGYAYCEAHIKLWGCASRYTDDDISAFSK